MELFNVYSLYPVEPVRGRGCFVYDTAGTEYLDLYGGHAVISIGHAHPDYARAVSEQVARLGFYSNSVENPLQTRLAEKLGRISGYADYSLFLCNSGAEANENALKLASFHTGRTKVLAFSKAFHGRTAGAVAATDNPAICAPFNRTANVEFVPLNDLAAARAKLATGEFAAVIIEGIQGVAGIHCPTDDFLRGLRKAATETGTQLILDEIQSGYGRTGHFFAHQAAGIRPDLITTAKGMGNGFPIGGVLIAPHFEARPGLLGTTFGGNHLACAAAIAAWQKAHEGACIEVVVNNAGIRDDVLMMWMEPQQWHSVIGTSLDGFYNVTRPLLKGMLVNRFGRIVNIVSLSGIKGLPGQANYAAAKGGVIAATKALAQEVARKGVTVNAIAPGFVRTDMTADIDEAELKKQIPAGRFCEPAEVADLAMFLISEQASYITGEVISINGGLYT